jgi:hypothetical protein
LVKRSGQDRRKEIEDCFSVVSFNMIMTYSICFITVLESPSWKLEIQKHQKVASRANGSIESSNKTSKISNHQYFPIIVNVQNPK